jgi:hypothetical protein
MLRFFERNIWTTLDGEDPPSQNPCPEPENGALLDNVLHQAREQLHLRQPHCAKQLCEAYIERQPRWSFDVLEMQSMLMFFGLGEAPNLGKSKEACDQLRLLFPHENLLCEERYRVLDWYQTEGLALREQGLLRQTKEIQRWFAFIKRLSS